jgi:hypothetical protein
MALAAGHLLSADLASTPSLHGNGFPDGLRVSKEEKNLESAQILHKYQPFQNLFFFSLRCGDFKTLFFPLLEMWQFSFFFGNFPKCSLHHVLVGARGRRPL